MWPRVKGDLVTTPSPSAIGALPRKYHPQEVKEHKARYPTHQLTPGAVTNSTLSADRGAWFHPVENEADPEKRLPKHMYDREATKMSAMPYPLEEIRSLPTTGSYYASPFAHKDKSVSKKADNAEYFIVYMDEPVITPTNKKYGIQSVTW